MQNLLRRYIQLFLIYTKVHFNELFALCLEYLMVIKSLFIFWQLIWFSLGSKRNLESISLGISYHTSLNPDDKTIRLFWEYVFKWPMKVIDDTKASLSFGVNIFDKNLRRNRVFTLSAENFSLNAERLIWENLYISNPWTWNILIFLLMLFLLGIVCQVLSGTDVHSPRV